VWSAVVLLAVLPASAAEVLTVAAAADLNPMLNQIADEFHKQSGIEVRVSYGASGSLFAQIQNGAPYDVFMSADRDYPERLVQAGAADANSLFVYGYGSLVLWARKGSPCDTKAPWQQRLTSDTVRRIAIANPDHAPWGRQAVKAMREANIYENVSAKLVLGENVSEAAAFARSGNADCALVPLTTALARSMEEAGHYVETGATNAQAAVVVARSAHKKAAEQFARFLSNDKVVALLRSHGLNATRAAYK
jgi:molybdate transport system substrate-binding protein